MAVKEGGAEDGGRPAKKPNSSAQTPPPISPPASHSHSASLLSNLDAVGAGSGDVARARFCFKEIQ